MYGDGVPALHGFDSTGDRNPGLDFYPVRLVDADGADRARDVRNIIYRHKSRPVVPLSERDITA